MLFTDDPAVDEPKDTEGVGKSIAIVGGGIIGMSIAWRVAQSGFDVVLHEKGSIGKESSWAGAGMLAPGGEFDHDSELAQMAIESRDLYRDFVEELQSESSAAIDFQETGALDLAYSAAEMEALVARTERQAAMGIPSRRLSVQQVETFWPRVRKDHLVGGYFYPGDASVNPRDVVAALQVACSKAGVKLQENSDIKTIAADAHDAVVIAAGAWSSSIEVVGVPALPASEPVRGHLLGYQQPAHACDTIVRRGETYLLQRSHGLLIVGASVEKVGFEREIDKEAVARLERQAAEVMPHLGETWPTEVWNGFRPGSDEIHLGKWHSKHVYLAYGHYRNGILLAPLTAQRIVSQINANL